MERQHQFKRAENLHQACTSDPGKFWKELKNASDCSKRRNLIPMEVYGINKQILYDAGSIKKVWKESFEKIYNEGLNEMLTSEWGNEVINTVGERWGT